MSCSLRETFSWEWRLLNPNPSVAISTLKFLELGLTGPSLLATPILLLLIISGFCSSHLIFNSMALFLRFHFRGILRDGPSKDLGAAECYNLSCDATSRTALVKENDLSRQVEQPVGG